MAWYTSKFNSGALELFELLIRDLDAAGADRAAATLITYPEFAPILTKGTMLNRNHCV